MASGSTSFYFHLHLLVAYLMDSFSDQFFSTCIVIYYTPSSLISSQSLIHHFYADDT